MFTGIIQAMGRVVGASSIPAGRRIVIDGSALGAEPAVGESIAISGCCLSVVDAARGRLAFDAVPETLARTTLGSLEPGAAVNIERSATPASLLGGHIVQGHVDGVGRVLSVGERDGWRVRIAAPLEMGRWLVPKGSVAVDGVSLTLAAVSAAEHWFEVALIPLTLRGTTLGAWKTGDRCNLEADVIAKTVVHYLENFAAAGLDGARTGGERG